MDVRISTPARPLDKVTRLIHNHHAEIISVCHLPEMEGRVNVFSIRLKKCNLQPIVADMEKDGIEVVSAIP
jgi:hypothetical protein